MTGRRATIAARATPQVTMGRIAVRAGVPREVAIELARTKPWWSRVVAPVPRAFRGWRCWRLKPAAQP